VQDAREVLEAIGAPPRLRVHGALVLEAADALLSTLRQLNVTIDADWVRAGAMLHDAGKTLHPSELDGPGSLHEEAGETLLLSHGVDPRIARCCVSHARWREDCALEELVVALADKLWKGVRVPDLEMRVIDRIGDRWKNFVALDSAFEAIANEGPKRLARSQGT
jgi:hypothetical protein